MEKISLVIPARNEESTILNVINEFKNHSNIDEIIVVDNQSSDKTSQISKDAGVIVELCSHIGYGATIKKGLKIAKNDLVFVCDSDIENPSKKWLDTFLSSKSSNFGIIKGVWSSDMDELPITNYLVKPILNTLYPDLSWMKSPISGIFLCNKQNLNIDILNDKYSFSIDIVLKIFEQGKDIQEAFIGEIVHKDRGIHHLRNIADETASFLIKKKKNILFVMAHPDDLEIWCGGTLINAIKNSDNVKVIVLTGNETRKKEALLLKELYPSIEIDFLNQTELVISSSLELTQTLSDKISKFSPNIIISHHYSDNHIDHRDTLSALQNSLMYLGSNFFPEKLLMCSPYFGIPNNNESFKMDTYIDITNVIQEKKKLIRNHSSQDIEYWIEQTITMNKLYGLKSKVGYAEAFETLNFYRTPQTVKL